MKKKSEKQTQILKSYGSRAEVFHGKAEKTTGGLKRGDLIQRDGRIKSKNKTTRGCDFCFAYSRTNTRIASNGRTNWY